MKVGPERARSGPLHRATGPDSSWQIHLRTAEPSWPELSWARSAPTARISVLVLIWLLGLGGCANTGSQVERLLSVEPMILSSDRPSDLIPPEGLRVTSTEQRQVALAWDPVLVGDVKGYAIKRSRAPEGDHVLIGQTASRFATVFIDSGSGPERLGDGQTYSYRVHPFDSYGRISRSHAHISATTEARPPIPTGLQSYSNLPRKVALSWQPSPSRSVVGYAIYRSPTPSGQWAQVGFAEGRLNTVWEDPVNGDLRLMHYRIEAINAFGAASDPSSFVRAVTKAEPLPPIGLEAEQSALGELELRWDPNVERDLERYEVFRADGPTHTVSLANLDSDTSVTTPSPRDSSEFTKERRVGQVSANELRFVDPNVGCGQFVRYRVRVIDRDRLMSAYSEPLMVEGATMNFELDTSGPTPRVVWDRDLLARWPSAEISETRQALPDRAVGKVTGRNDYDLQGLPPGLHTLRITLFNASDEPDVRREESPTCTIEVSIPQAGADTP